MDLFSSNFGYPTVVISSGLFYLNNYWILNALTPSLLQKSPKKQWKWRNTANSLIHSFITGCGACLCFWSAPDMRRDLISEWTPASYTLISISIGYFIYDLIDMAVNDPKSKTYELLLHHFMVILSFMTAMTQRKYIGYTLMALLVEVNSVFLHSRQLLLLNQWNKSSSVYRINNSFNLGTFVVFRILTLGWMTRWLVHHRMDMSSFDIYVAGSTLTIVMGMNIILLQRLLNSDYRQVPKTPTDEHMKVR